MQFDLIHVAEVFNSLQESGKVLEDAGSGKEDMFEDCPDDIVVDEVERLRAQLDTTIGEKESFARQIEVDNFSLKKKKVR